MSLRVLLASRLPDEPDATLTAAMRLAERLGAELMLVYVAVELSTLPQLQVTTGEDIEDLRHRMMAEIERRAEEFLHRHVPDRQTGVAIVEGEIPDQVARVARENRVDYLVIGTEARTTLRQVILGSTSQKIIQRSPCPVLVVPTAPSA